MTMRTIIYDTSFITFLNVKVYKYRELKLYKYNQIKTYNFKILNI